MITKIISGGQTGADVGALLGARNSEIETGGTAPNGYWTERGRDKTLIEFGLVASEEFCYVARTLRNVLDSDATCLFGDMSSSGSKLTIKNCKLYGKPHIINPSVEGLHAFVEALDIRTLNVAGNRESVNPGIQDKVRDFIGDYFCHVGVSGIGEGAT